MLYFSSRRIDSDRLARMTIWAKKAANILGLYEVGLRVEVAAFMYTQFTLCNENLSRQENLILLGFGDPM